MTDDIQVRLMPFPGTIKECVTHNPDGSFTIFINESLDQLSRMKAYHHAMRHIENNDFEKFNADEIEYAAHFC